MAVAFDDTTLEPNPTWTRLDTGGLVASYTIDRGRQYELDRTDGGRATVVINDKTGILDPTNSGGTYFGKIEPLLQCTLGRWNPVLSEWQTRFRGFIAEYDYDYDPSLRVSYLRLSLVDLFEILQSVEMLPGSFGDTPPTESTGQVFFDNANVDDRINQVYGNVGLDSTSYVTFSGNVYLFEAVYSPGESAMTAVQEAVDAEFPGVGNLYPDRFGRLAFHGRGAKFNPAQVAAGAGNVAWDWHHWRIGDWTAAQASPSTLAKIGEFSFNRGLSKIVNQAIATPKDIADADVAGQIVQDTSSIGTYGIRSWSAQGLLTERSLIDNSGGTVETKRFATYYVDNYKIPSNRITALTLRSRNPHELGAAIHWKVLCESDIADQIDVTIAGSHSGGTFNADSFFIEGIHEESRPLNATYDDVTITFDVSPASYYTTNPFPQVPPHARATATAVGRPGTVFHT